MIARIVAGICFATLVLLTPWVAPAARAAELAVTPSSVSGEYAGMLTFVITGVTEGATVLVEKTLDLDGNLQIDAGEPVIQSFEVTDGQSFSIAGVPDSNVPGDDDGLVNGEIHTALDFQQSAVNRAIGRFIYRVSAPGVTPLSAPFAVTQPDHEQSVTGTITSGTVPVPGAVAVLLSGDSVITAFADGDGVYLLNAPVGTYQLLAGAPGFLFDAATAPQVTIGSGVSVTQHLTMTPGDRTITARLTDMASGAGIAGVQLIAQSATGLITLAFSDANGEVQLSVVTGQWSIEPSAEAAAMLGYVPGGDQAPIDTAGGSVAGVSIQWRRVTALMHGRVVDDLENPLAGVRVDATLVGGNMSAVGFSDANGNYSVGVVGGTWRVQPSGVPGGVIEPLTVTLADGDAVRVALTIQLCNAHLRGRVVDESSNAIDGVRVDACVPNQGGGACAGANTGTDGLFDVCARGGTWSLSVNAGSLVSRLLVGSQVTATVAPDGERNDLTILVRRATQTISGRVGGQDGDMLSGIRVYASASIDNVDYGTQYLTNAQGGFSLAVSSGTWQVAIACDQLMERGYRCPESEVAVVPPDAVVNFVLQAETAACAGDCDGDGFVTVDEILILVNLSLTSAAPVACTSADINGDDVITIDEILAAVTNALNACP
jgi:hypothetical protein